MVKSDQQGTLFTKGITPTYMENKKLLMTIDKNHSKNQLSLNGQAKMEEEGRGSNGLNIELNRVFTFILR